MLLEKGSAKRGRKGERIRDDEKSYYLHFNLHIKTCLLDRPTRVREIRYLELHVCRISVVKPSYTQPQKQPDVPETVHDLADLEICTRVDPKIAGSR